MKNLPALLPLLLSISHAVSAQSVRFESFPSNLPPNLAGPCMDAAAGDADGDGDLDLALAMEFQRNRLLLNDGTGSFIDASTAMPDDTSDVLPETPRVDQSNTSSIMNEIERSTSQVLSNSANATREQSLFNDSAVSGRPQPAQQETEPR